MGGLPPKAAQSAMWLWPSTPYPAGMRATRRGSVWHPARRRNREIRDQQAYPRHMLVAPAVVLV